MSAVELFVQTLNCSVEAMIVTFYLYNVLKKDYRYARGWLIISTVIMFGIIEAMTLLCSSPWIKLTIMVTSMIATAIVLFESKLRHIIFYCLMFLVVILASEIIPFTAMNLMNIGTPESNMNSGMGQYIGMACSKLFCFWFAIYIAEYLKPKQTLQELAAHNIRTAAQPYSSQCNIHRT